MGHKRLLTCLGALSWIGGMPVCILQLNIWRVGTTWSFPKNGKLCSQLTFFRWPYFQDWSPKKVFGCSRRRLKGPGWIPKSFLFIFTWLFLGWAWWHRSDPFEAVWIRSKPFGAVQKRQKYVIFTLWNRQRIRSNPYTFKTRSNCVQNPFKTRSATVRECVNFMLFGWEFYDFFGVAARTFWELFLTLEKIHRGF